MSKDSRELSQSSLEMALWTVLLEHNRARRGSSRTGEAWVDVEASLAVLARIAARLVMIGDGAARRMKLAASFDTRFLEEHRGRELALHDK